jgi:NAD(P)-dependent dehydrogenase (short-subunit alcohol dehydrogenase family)
MTAEDSFARAVVVVYGGAVDLGRLCAFDLASRGATVLVDVDDSVGIVRPHAQEVEVDAGSDAGPLPAALVGRAVQVFGRLDAAIALDPRGVDATPLSALSCDDIRESFDVGLRRQIVLAQRALAEFRRSGSGRLVLSTSGAGLFGNSATPLFAAAEAAVAGLVRSLALSVEDPNIRINAIAPIVDCTPFDGGLRSIGHVDLDHYGPEHVLPMIAYLAHEACQPHGTIISAGGGRFARIATVTFGGLFEPEADPATIAESIDRVLEESYPVEPISAGDELLLIDV